MNKVEVEFHFESGKTNKIEYEENEKMNEIYKRCPLNSKKDFNKIYFIYNGGRILDIESTWIKIANQRDKPRKRMTILVRDIIEDELTSKYIKCPGCGENVEMKIENYKISFDCKNYHKINNILFNKYEDYQKKAISKIVTCDKNGLHNYECLIHHKHFGEYCNKCKKNMYIECS